jgi:hypothetical protein
MNTASSLSAWRTNSTHASRRNKKERFMARKSELQTKFEAAIEKGLESNSAGERTAALKAAADLLNPNLGELQTRIKQAEDRLDEAKNSLKEIIAERDALLAEMSALREQAAKVGPLETELADLKVNFDARVAEMRNELVGEATQQRFKAEAAERRANETLATAQSRFGQAGLQVLLDYVKTIIEQNHIAEPTPESLPTGISSLILTAWGHSPIKAQLMLAYAKTFREPSANFKQQLLKILLGDLPSWPATYQPESEDGLPLPPIETPQSIETIPNLPERREVLVAMASKWNVLTEVQRLADDERARHQGRFLLAHQTALAAQERDLQTRGYGRTEISAEPVSATGYDGPCLDPDNCCCPKHNGARTRFRNSLDGVVEE